jgi:hypothetical protein
MALSMLAGALKIFGLVTKRRKLASTIGISVNAAPALAAINAFDIHALAGARCGWSLRAAATSRLTSGAIIIQRAEQRLVGSSAFSGVAPAWVVAEFPLIAVFEFARPPLNWSLMSSVVFMAESCGFLH